MENVLVMNGARNPLTASSQMPTFSGSGSARRARQDEQKQTQAETPQRKHAQL